METNSVTTKSNMIKIPYIFYRDHEERELDTPEAIKYSTKKPPLSHQNWRIRLRFDHLYMGDRIITHVWISAEDIHLTELWSDADYYATCFGPRDGCPSGIYLSARATVKALENHFQR